MVDQANPERVRIIESKNNHLSVTHGVVSSQKAPMAVIENSLGLNGDLSGMLGNRQVLIVEGGTDSLILHKLSGLLKADNKEGLSDQIYLWPAQTASKTPMYAGFAVGQKWDAGVLLDSDTAGLEAKAKIEDIYLKNLVDFDKQQFRVLMLGKTAGINKTDAAIEDLFPDQFYIDCVNNAFGLGIHIDDLSVDGSDMITTKIEQILKKRYSHNKLDKSRVLIEMLREFDSWKKTSDLPKGTAQKAAKLIKTINSSFSKDDLKE
jgi:predicted ATP-dependent endonuclease of OLD family